MAEDGDDDNLEEQLLLLQDDDFITEEQRQEQAAKERRLARKRRLQQVSAQDDELPPKAPIKTEAAPPSIKTEERQQQQQQQPVLNTTAASMMNRNIKVEENDDRKDKDDGDSDEKGDDDDEDDFDMFSSSVSPLGNDDDDDVYLTKKKKPKLTSANPSASNNPQQGNQNVDQQQDWDDAEGYYRATIGEIITIDVPADADDVAPHPSMKKNHHDQEDALLRFRVSGVIGKGVFSTVLKCNTVRDDENGNGTDAAMTNGSSRTHSLAARLPPQVALKCIRHNETMAKAAYNEIRFLQRFIKTKSNTTKQGRGSSNGNHHHPNSDDAVTTTTPGVVPLLLPHNKVPLEFRGHTVLVFPYMEYNLRDVLQKFGKGVGLSLTAVRSYFGQLLSAATHLKQHTLIHADIKLDNILVSHDFTTVQICDFGSAVQGSTNDSGESSEPIVTPYLVSRFYRAPEIILGLIPTYAIDLWSLAVTAAELFLGKVLFQGKTNNDMLHLMMQQMGPFSNKVIRQHLVQTQRFPIKAHFQQVAAQYVFRQETVDPVTGQDVHKNVSLVATTAGGGYSPPQLQSKLLRAKSAKDSRSLVLQFCDLLQKCLALDPSRRIAVKMALHHDFFKTQQQQQDQQE